MEALHADWKVAPFWRVERTVAPKQISQDMKCDTLVVGAGITGLATGFSLSSHQKVIVADSGLLGEGSTGWSAGILSLATTLDLSTVELLLSTDTTRQIAFYLQDSLSQAKNALSLTEPDWQSGSALYAASRKSHRKLLEGESEARHKYGLQTEMLEEIHLKKEKLAFSSALELGGEHAVHPIKLLLALASKITLADGAVLEKSPVTDWRNEGGKFIARCGSFRIEAQHLVICTGLGSDLLRELGQVKRFCLPVMSHILVTEPSEAVAQAVRKNHRIALWDSIQLYHYVRYFSSGRILVGGEESPGVLPGQTVEASDEHIQRLYAWAGKHHNFALPPIEHSWKASLIIPADGLPFLKLKQFGENMLIAAITDGIPFAFVLGRVIAGLIENQEHQLSQVMGPSRPMPLDARLLALLPDIPLVRRTAYETAFALLRLRDLVV